MTHEERARAAVNAAHKEAGEAFTERHLVAHVALAIEDAVREAHRSMLEDEHHGGVLPGQSQEVAHEP